MKNNLEIKLDSLKKANRKALICYITAGHPDLNTSEKIIEYLYESGTDIVEIGLPFSDPIADGPVIQASSHKALLKGVNTDKIFTLVSKVTKKTAMPVIIMTYLNPVFKYGIERFFKAAQTAGVSGLIVPDATPESAGIFEKTARKYNISVIYLLAPTTVKNRQKLIINRSTGFVYIVSLTGVTGPRSKFDGSIENFVKGLKKQTKKPLMLGFGISNPQQIKSIKKSIDGIIIGSALIKAIENSNKNTLKSNIDKFIKPFRRELDR
ncbi:MAG: tryptophan synthase subunit alpha [Elusimicrobia bacterium RIFOXYA2_FULL_39_19]|nr:MAG: tryptophan synthase subunit alpha [Elusimicrobia bacterium RIFOXYA2_FULL_39_19]